MILMSTLDFVPRRLFKNCRLFWRTQTLDSGLRPVLWYSLLAGDDDDDDNDDDDHDEDDNGDDHIMIIIIIIMLMLMMLITNSLRTGVQSIHERNVVSLRGTQKNLRPGKKSPLPP